MEVEKRYKRMGDFATTAGPKFEVKITALACLRALNEGREFELGTNADFAGVFDDIVLKVPADDSDTWKTFFVQLKHRERNKQVTRKMLLGSDPKFSLPKYYQASLDIKTSMSGDDREVLFDGNFSDAKFIIFTNAPGSSDLGPEYLRDVEMEKAERYFGTGVGSVYRFDPDDKKNGDLLQCLGEEGEEADRKAFLQQFYLFAGQWSDEQLDQLIKQQLSKWEAILVGAKDANPVEPPLLFDRFIADLSAWCELRVKGGKIAVLNEAATLLHETRRRLLVETSSSRGVDSQTLGVEFKCEAVAPLKDVLRDTHCAVVHVEATERSTRLTCAKVFQAIGKDQLLYFPADALLEFEDVLEWYWKHEKRQYLVVTISDSDTEEDKSEKILESLKRFCPEPPDKKQRKKKKTKANSGDDLGSLSGTSIFSRILVIVAIQGNSIVNKLTTELSGSLNSFADVFEFAQLEDKVQTSLLEETAASVQNHPTTLLELFDGKRRKADELMDASSTADFLAGDKEQSIGPDLTHDISCYIPRILEQILDLKPTLLQLPSLDESINVVCNSVEDVWALLGRADSSINTKNIEDVIEFISESSNVDERFEENISIGEDFQLGVFSCNCIGLRFGQPDSVSAVRVRFNLPDNEDASPDPKWFLFVPETTDQKDADLLAEFNSAHHFLRLRDGRLRWSSSMSNCSMDVIRSHLDESQVVPVVSQGVAAVGNRVVLLCAEPGMGKSTLMTDVAKKSKDTHPEALVLSVTLNDHVQLFVEGLHSDSSVFLMRAMGFVTNLQQLWFKLALAMENLVVLLDGFEEICPKYEKQCLELLTGLLKTKTRKIWVTSRNTKKIDLEDHLGILATKLCAFDKDDQKSFLKQYWADAMSDENNTSELLDNFVEKVIEKAEGAINDREKDFMKVPLHTLMMAEVFKPDLSDLARIVHSTEKLNLIDLFDRYCKIKIDIYLQNKVQLGSVGVLYDTMFTQTEESCVEGHGIAALMAILDDDDIEDLTPRTIREQWIKLEKNFDDGQDKTGFIVSVLNGKPRFLHRVFAEYFAAKWFAKHLMENIAFLERRLYSGEFSVVREMFDSTLAKGYPLHSAVLQEDLKEVQRLAEDSDVVRSKDRGGRTALHLAASLGTSNSGESNGRKKDILDFLVSKCENADEVDDVFSRSPLHYAAATASWPAIDRLLRCKVNKECLSTLITDPAKESMLTFASTHDLDVLMEFCLAQGLPVDHSLERAGAILSVACASGSERVAMLLLQGGADVLAKDPSGTTPLQHATRTGSTALVEAILDKISDNKVRAAYIKGSDAFGENSLQSATKSEFVDIVRVLLHAIPDAKDKTEFVKASDRFGDNPLLIAARNGNVAIVDMLLKAMPKPAERLTYIKSADVNGDTALRLACKGGFKEVVELVLREIAKPNDKLECIKAGDFYGNNSLIIATLKGYAEIVRTLLQAIPEPAPRIQCVQGATMEGETPLRLAASSGHAEVVEAILSSLDDSPEKTAYIRSCGATGECALVLATRLGHAEVVRCILAGISDSSVRLEYIQACWPGGERLLIFATRMGSKETVDAILSAVPEERRKEHVLDCWSSNGETLLGLATKLKLEEIVDMVKHFFN